MLTTQRKQLILESLKADGQVVAKDLSLRWELSEDTIRRDLRELAQEGLLLRVHGGALPASPAVIDLQGRQQISSAAKSSLGQAAARMVKPGQVIILDGGTTNEKLVKYLPADLAITVITHSPTIAVALLQHSRIEVVIIGGKLFKHSAVTVGAAAIDSISRIRADIYFMGVTGVHPEGLSTGDMEESYVKRALHAAAAETIVLATADKINTVSPYKICDCQDITEIITETVVTKKDLRAYNKTRIRRV